MTEPKIYFKNPNSVMCRILRSQKEVLEFLKTDYTRRCLINDWSNYHYFCKGEPPYNQANLNFAIKVALYEACSGQSLRRIYPTPCMICKGKCIGH